MIDVLICGSGASAVHAAVPLVEAGLHVVMVDAAMEDAVYKDLIPDQTFDQIRKSDSNQHRFFLGDNFEGIPLGPVRVGAQLTPPRQYLQQGVEEYLPVRSPKFQAFQTLALGGLAAGWGAAVPPFNDEDMAGWPINRATLQEHYLRVAKRIGVCGDGEDDLAQELGDVEWLMDPLVRDPNASTIFEKYDDARDRFHRAGLIAGSPRLAICTNPLPGRERFQYNNMEFYSDANPGVYRPRYTLKELKKKENFEFLTGRLVRTYRDLDGIVEVDLTPIGGGDVMTLKAARLVLCAGAMGSARIVLRSNEAWNKALPLVANPYTYYPCLNFARMLSYYNKAVFHSLTQVMLLYNPRPGKLQPVQGQIYSYRSLMTFKLMKESPLAMRESRALMQALGWYFVVLGVHHPDMPGKGKRLWLERGDGEPVLRVAYRRSPEEEKNRRKMERGLARLMPRLGCLPLKRIDPGSGASIHYAGTLPMGTASRRFTTTPSGRLRGTRGVYVADGSVLPSLPAKGLTFTLMANADRVGCLLARRLK